jgi:hypothetical protein
MSECKPKGQQYDLAVPAAAFAIYALQLLTWTVASAGYHAEQQTQQQLHVSKVKNHSEFQLLLLHAVAKHAAANLLVHSAYFAASQTQVTCNLACSQAAACCCSQLAAACFAGLTLSSVWNTSPK